MVPVHHKYDYGGERTIFPDDNFPSEKYNLWVATLGWPALHMYSCDWVWFVAYTLVMCPKLTQYQTHKHYIAGSLKPQSPSARWVRGISMGGPIALWTKSQRITMDFVMSVAVHSRGSHGSGQFHVMEPVPDHQMSQGDRFGKMIFKIDYLFYTSNIGDCWCLHSYFYKLLQKKG